MDQVLGFIDDQRARFVEELATWVKIPAISSKSAAHVYDELSRLEDRR
jgi:hypothetical protein